MKSSLYQIKIRDLMKLDKVINLNPAYQRDYIAKDNRKWQRQLIATIFEGNRVVPNLYARTNSKEMAEGKLLQEFREYTAEMILNITEMIDGQQRHRTIVDFLNDEFKLGVCVIFEDDEKYDISGYKWSQVQASYPEIENKFLESKLRLVSTFSKNETDIMEMFCQLNDLNTMTEAEKRNAIDSAIAAYVRGTSRLDNEWRGTLFPMHELFSRDSKSLKSLYTSLTFKKMAQDELLAKLIALTIGIAYEKGVGNNTLRAMYIDPVHKTTFSSKKIKSLLDTLETMLKNKVYKSKINLGVILNLAMVVLYLQNNKEIRVKNWHKVMEWFYNTHETLSEVTDKEKKAGIEETNYHQKTRLSSDAKGLLLRRQYLLSELNSCEGLVGVDKKRVISDKEKFELWLQSDDGKGNKVCELCEVVLAFEDAVKAHKDAWSEGGETTPENTLITCKQCNKPRD